MTEAPSHLIRLPAGRVRVLRLVVDASGVWPLAYDVPRGEAYCMRCGCTDSFGCAGGCVWVSPQRNLCSACLKKELGI